LLLLPAVVKLTSTVTFGRTATRPAVRKHGSACPWPPVCRSFWASGKSCNCPVLRNGGRGFVGFSRLCLFLSTSPHHCVIFVGDRLRSRQRSSRKLSKTKLSKAFSPITVVRIFCVVFCFKKLKF
jgi:hypothetical protein